MRLAALLLAVGACSKQTPVPAPAAPSPLPWASPCRVPVERTATYADNHDRYRFVLETVQDGDRVRFARRDVRLVELNGEDMTTPEQLENAAGVAAPERAVPDLMIGGDGQVGFASPADLDPRLDRHGLEEIAREGWFTLVGAWRDHQPGDRDERRAFYRSEGERATRVHAEQRGDLWTLSYSVAGKDMLGIPWLRSVVQGTVDMNDVERQPVPSVESALVSGEYRLSYEVTFVPGTHRPAKARWSQRVAYDAEGLQSELTLVNDYSLDWSHAEGCGTP